MKKWIFMLVALWPVAAEAGLPISLTVTMNEAVTVTGTPRVAVDVGGVTRYATYTSGSGTSALTFTLTPQAGDVDLDGIAVSSPVDLNGGTITDLSGNALAVLTFTPPNTSGIKVNYPSLGMDFVYDADGRYTLNGTVYNDLPSFLTAAGGTFTRASTATYFDSTGTLQTAAANAPRFDYDPVTHAAKGILIEESRANLIYPSDVAPPNYNCTQILNAMLAPDGTMSGSACTATSAGMVSYAAHLYSNFLAGTTYTYSIFVKKAGPQYVRLSSNDVNVYNIWAVFDLQAGTRVAGTGSIQSIGNGWYRLTAIGSSSTSGAQRVLVIPTNSTGLNRVASSVGEVQLYSWGGQLEVGAFASSYIPTSAAAVTRAADYLSIPTASWYNAPSGTLWASGVYDAVGSTTSRGLLYCDDGTPNSAIGFYLGDNLSPRKMGIQVMYSGTGQVSAYSAAYTTGATISAALAYQTDDVIGSFGGVLTSLDTSAMIPTCSRLIVGNLRGNWGNVTGHVLKARYYPTRVPNSQLNLMTQ